MDATVREVLERYDSALRPLDAPTRLGNAGGMSGACLWRFVSWSGELALRRWPVPGPAPATLDRIHAWLGETRFLGFPSVPLPEARGSTWTECGGHLWELTPWMPGTVEAARPPRLERVEAALEALARFHRALERHVVAGPSPGIQARLEEVERWIRGEFSELGSVLRKSESSAERELARRWLELARDPALELETSLRRLVDRPVPLQPCLRDARGEHILFEGDRVAGLVDFGAMGVDSVATDLARLRSDWLGTDPTARARAIDAYQRIRPLDPDETALADGFEHAADILVGGHWARWRFLSGTRFEDPSAVGRGLEKGLERLIARTREGGRFLG